MPANIKGVLKDDTAIGQWGLATYQPKVPDYLTEAAAGVNDVAQALQAALQLAIAALEVSKAYTVGYVDPVSVIAKAVADEVQALSQDLGRVGLYVTGDWGLLHRPFNELAGGFAEYERRMVARLTDRSDPTRPQASASTVVTGVFLYLGEDLSTVFRVIAFVKALLRFLNLSVLPAASLPVPVPLGVTYGKPRRSLQDALALASAAPANEATVRWRVATAPRHDAMVPFPSPPPGGFLVCVSTVPDGIRLVYDRPLLGQGKEAGRSKPVQRREQGVVHGPDGAPLVLHGGADLLSLPKGTLGWNDAIGAEGNLIDGAARVHGMVGDSPVPLDQLQDADGTYLLQRSFWVSTLATVTSWPTGSFLIDLKLSEMPEHAEVVLDGDGRATLERRGKPATFHVRVMAVESDALKEAQYDLVALSKTIHDGRPVIAPFVAPLPAESVGMPGPSIAVTFPNSHTAQFLRAVQTALAILVLARIDLTDVSEQGLSELDVLAIRQGKMYRDGVVLEPTGLEQFRFLLPLLAMSDLDASGDTPGSFRSRLLKRVRVVAGDMYRMTGAMPEVEERVIKASKELREVTLYELAQQQWGVPVGDASVGMTILDALADPSTDYGLAANLRSVGAGEAVIENALRTPGLIVGRKPHFAEYKVTEDVVLSAGEADVQGIMAKASPGMRAVYGKGIKEDGSLLLGPGLSAYATTLAKNTRVMGSGDSTPVIYANLAAVSNLAFPVAGAQDADPAFVFCRTALAAVGDGELLRQAAMVLGIAASAMGRPARDGAWLNVRLRDALPALDDALEWLASWLANVRAGIKSVSDVVDAYVAFLEARLADLQQLILRVNALLQSLANLSVALPVGAGLVLVSEGTDGLVADFIAAKDKPPSGSRTYGAGIAIVMPTPLPTFVLDLFKPPAGANGAKPVFSPEHLPVIAPAGPDDEPPM